MRTRKLVLSLLLVVTMVAAACAQATQPPPPVVEQPTQAPPVEQPTQAPAPTEVAAPTEAPKPTEAPTATTAPQPTNKVATFIFTQEFDTLNPLYTNMWFSAITFQLWNCYAWTFDEKNNPVPVLVKEMPTTENGGISADGTVITMKLRDDLKWSDGQPITADDFIFTYQMTIDPKNAVATTHPYEAEVMKSVTAPDPQTVVITFVKPFAPWMGLLWKGLLPKHILQPVVEKDGTLDKAEWNRAPTVGCGPYNFKEWESGSFARFVANDSYWLGKPKIDEIFIRFVPDDASQVAALKAGDGDLGTFISYPDIADLEKAGVQVVAAFSGYNEGIYFNQDPKTANPAMLDEKVRQAIAMAIDRESLTKDLLLGRTKPAASDWDNMPYVDPTLKPWPYDPEKAKQLLDEAGWKDTNGDGTRDKDGKELVLKYGTTTREIRKDTQAVLQQQLAAVGVKVDLLNFDSDVFFGSFADNGPAATGQLDMWEYSGSPNFPDPDVSEWLCDQIPTAEKPSGTNWEGLCDKDLDQLFKEQATQVDFTQRQQTFYKITSLIFNKVYWLGLWQDPDQWAVKADLKNVKLSGATPFFNIMEWDLVK